MPNLSLYAIDTLVRPPIPGEIVPPIGNSLEIVGCRNEVISAAVLIQAEGMVEVNYSGPGETCILKAISVPVPEANGELVDPLIMESKFEVKKSQVIWIQFKFPREMPAGDYQGMLQATCKDESAEIPVNLHVKKVTLPDPKDWSFFLNVWMNPGAIAREYQVPLWSSEHWNLLEKYVSDLASHGQKTVVASIVEDPWCSQTYTPYPTLVVWKKTSCGWEFDFSNLDRYILLHEKYGINRAIHCYSPVHSPGTSTESTITYLDENGQEQKLVLGVGTPEYSAIWGKFFQDLEAHFTKMGWVDKTYVAFDEKSNEVMLSSFQFLRETVPNLKISLAANQEQKLYEDLDDISLYVGFDQPEAANRRPSETRIKSGKLTTYYVCCGPAYPNTFLFSPLVESRILPWISMQRGFDGLLRWSYDDWTESPYTKTKWGEWGTGDCFFVYPGKDRVVTSVRWEELREGIQDYELMRLLQEKISATPEPERSPLKKQFQDAVELACRNVDGRTKDTNDLRHARNQVLVLLESLS